MEGVGREGKIRKDGMSALRGESLLAIKKVSQRFKTDLTPPTGSLDTLGTLDLLIPSVWSEEHSGRRFRLSEAVSTLRHAPSHSSFDESAASQGDELWSS